MKIWLNANPRNNWLTAPQTLGNALWELSVSPRKSAAGLFADFRVRSRTYVDSKKSARISRIFADYRKKNYSPKVRGRTSPTDRDFAGRDFSPLLLTRVVNCYHWLFSVGENPEEYDYLELLEGQGMREDEAGAMENPGVLPNMGKLYQESLIDPEGRNQDMLNWLHFHLFTVARF